MGVKRRQDPEIVVDAVLWMMRRRATHELGRGFRLARKAPCMKTTWLRFGYPKKVRFASGPAVIFRSSRPRGAEAAPPLNRPDFLKQSSGFPDTGIVLGSRPQADGRDL